MRWLTLIAAVAVLALAGCGGDDNESTAKSTPRGDRDGGRRLGRGRRDHQARGRPSALKFDKNELTAKAGKVTISMDNPSDLPHAVAIEGNGVDVDGKTVGKGGKSTASADLKPGKYEFYCPVDGHKAAGMKGKLTVS